MTIFSAFGRYILFFRNKANIYYIVFLVSHCFILTPKCVTLNGHFTLNPVFTQLRLEFLHAFQKQLCTN